MNSAGPRVMRGFPGGRDLMQYTIDDSNYVGMLTLTQTAENTWDLKFRILRQR